MKENDLNTFLKENKAILSYLKDLNGNKLGVIIAVPGNGEPKIGYSFFPEVATANVNCTRNLYENITYVNQAPKFAEELKTMGMTDKTLRNIKFPIGNILTRFNPSYINKKEAILLARKRANDNSKGFYITTNKKDAQAESVICSGRPYDDFILGIDPYDDMYTSFRVARTPEEVACIRKQVKAFEYRALKYFKYVIPSYKR